ncbi:MAG: DUF1738 domain-containing protein [Eubacterium sp.]|nr:DUF1738 domain-containing protein [Eubacterium sp.]
MNKLREDMIKEFIASLEQERIPWRKKWTEQGGRPCNAVTGNNYRGINVLWLMYVQEKMGYDDNRWCTFKQAQEQGWRIRKGEKGTRVEFWSWYDTETKKRLDRKEMLSLRKELDRDEFQKRVKPMDRVSIVFNGRQIEGIPEYTPAHNVLDEETLIAQRAVLLNNMALSFYEGEAGAYYQPATDSVHMPDIDRFENEYAYMATFLHEAGHATGHASRLNRNVKGSFGTPDYAREELRAEIASAFTAQILGLPGADSNFDNHKAYIQDWISILEKEPNELFQAIKEAEKISDYLIEKGEFNLVQEKEHNTMTERMIEMDEFSREQQEEIRLGQDYGLDVNIYARSELTANQMNEIRKGLEKEQTTTAERKMIEMDKFNEMQQNQIQLGLEKGLDVSVYADPKFNGDQMSAIRNGLELEVDVSKYADPKYDFEQMMQIHFGLEFGVDVSVYAEPKFNADQMREIRWGLQKELDVSAYADPKFSHEQMSEIRWGLQEGLDARIYADPRFDLEQIKEIQKGLEQGLDVSKYADPKYDFEQMMQIHFGLEDGADVSVYADPNYNPDQMSAIRWGLHDGLDVSKYADPKFTVKQMEQIRYGLMSRVDAGRYANPDYGFLQMAEIRKGLESGVDVGLYAAQDLNALQMDEIRQALEKGENVMKWDQKVSILGYYAGEDGSQYILYQTGDPEKEYLTNGEKKWSDPEEIKRILSELKQIPHLKDRQRIMGYLQEHYPYDAITGYMQKIVGEVSYSTNRAVGEVIQYTSAEEYLKTVREDIEYQSSSGFGYRTFTNDPETRKGIDDIVYDQFGERNPHDLDYYRDPYNPADKRKMTVEEIYLSLPPEKQEMYDLALDQKHSDLEEMTRLIEERRQELQQKQIQERSRTHGKI